jgi:hypothetical protein
MKLQNQNQVYQDSLAFDEDKYQLCFILEALSRLLTFFNN